MWAPDAGELLGAAAPLPCRQPDRRASLVLSLKDNALNELDVVEAGLDIRKSNRVAIEITMGKYENNVIGGEERENQLETNGFSFVKKQNVMGPF